MGGVSTPAGVAVLGATGSIGASTLAVMDLHPERYRAVALTAWRDVEAMHRLCVRYAPAVAAMGDAEAAAALRARCAGTATEVLAGPEGLIEAAAGAGADIVVAAIVGAAGLAPTLAAARAGRRLLLANKEALVMAGPLFMAAVRDGGAELIPVDSEQNAIFQCLAPYRCGTPPPGVRRLLLTASGGPFRETPLPALAAVTPAQACAHPNWRMGPKISVDSATLMNKGLEVIETAWLFGLDAGRVEVLVHPQSIVHSLVEYADGSLLAQLAVADMRVPIAQALAYPQRMASGADVLDLARLGRLEFATPDAVRFPALRLAYAALRAGGTAGAILNAANEVAVQAFLDGRLGFDRIAAVVAEALERTAAGPADSLAAVLEADAAARRAAGACLALA
jgi:1-deoxy-D-xylulose-5-phosphate reductoisomerase